MNCLFSIAYLPSISWFQKFVQAEHVLIEQHEHFIKQTYRNRAEIYGANGMLPLIVPVDHQELASKPIKEIKISSTQPWKKIHWRSIESAYRNSPYFEYYEDKLRPIYEKDYIYLFEWNCDLLTAILGMLDVQKTISFTNSYGKEYHDDNDYRQRFLPGKKRASQTAYHQVFSDRYGFIPDLSIIDLLFNEGPKTLQHLQSPSS